MHWPLRNQILLPFAGALLVALLTVTGIDAYLAARRTEEQINRQLKEIATTLREIQFPLTDAILHQTRGLSGAEFLVTDSRSRVVAGTIAGVETLARASGGEGGETATRSVVELQGKRYFQTTVARPALREAGPQWVHILYPEAVWAEARWEATWPPLVVGGVALVVVIGLAISLAHQLSQPLGEVTEQVSRIARGDYQPMPTPERDDEIRQLVLSVNQLVAELIVRTEAVQRSERLAMLGKLSGGLAHHLRNSVTGAKLALQLHERDCTHDDRECLAVAQRQMQLTEEHLRRFLDVGQPRPLAPEPVDLHALVEELGGLMRPACLHRGVELTLPARPEVPVMVDADPGQLRLALLNLLMNAMEAAGMNGQARVELVPVPSANGALPQIEARVLDSGPGPAAEMVRRLFEPFATDKPAGVGLGLTVARQVAEAHGGSLRFERIAGETCFALRLPRKAT